MRFLDKRRIFLSILLHGVQRKDTPGYDAVLML